MSHRDDPEPYDLSQPFDAQKLMDGFTMEQCQVPVDPDSPLDRTMAEYREHLARGEVQPIDSETFMVTPVALRLGDVAVTVGRLYDLIFIVSREGQQSNVR